MVRYGLERWLRRFRPAGITTKCLWGETQRAGGESKRSEDDGEGEEEDQNQYEMSTHEREGWCVWRRFGRGWDDIVGKILIESRCVEAYRNVSLLR